MRRSRQHHRQLLAEISATPLLDLVFILLFAFMVALPMVSRSDALLRATDDETSALSRQTPASIITLQVRAPDELIHEGAALTAAEVEQRLQRDWLPAQPDLGVRIEIAPEQPVTALTEVMTLLSRSGVRRTSVRIAGGS